jgi:hypothetical protein
MACGRGYVLLEYLVGQEHFYLTRGAGGEVKK